MDGRTSIHKFCVMYSVSGRLSILIAIFSKVLLILDRAVVFGLEFPKPLDLIRFMSVKPRAVISGQCDARSMFKR